MASIDVAKLLNKITQDIPGINTVLKALAKWDVSALTDVPDGAMQATTDTNNNLTINKKVSGSYTPVTKLMHDVDKLDGYHASTSATANAIPVRNASGALPGNILGNSATADTATALAAGSVVPVYQGGTGATTTSQARANLGVADGEDFTTHVATQASPSVEGHVKLDAFAADGSNTAAPGGFGLGRSDAGRRVTDLDTVLENGQFSFLPTATGLPSGWTAAGVGITYSHNASVKIQKIFRYIGPGEIACYARCRFSSGTWGAWIPLPHGITDSLTLSSSTIAASATAVKAVNDATVHLVGTETISGDKTFTGLLYQKSTLPAIKQKHTTLTAGAPPSTDTQYAGIIGEDSSGFNMGGISFTYQSSGVRKCQIGFPNSAGTTRIWPFVITVAADDTSYATVTSPPAGDNSSKIATTAWVKNNAQDVGDIVASFATSKAGHLLCNGGTYSRTTYDALFAILGTSFGAGDGSTTFNVPDFRGRTLQGANANLKAVLAAGLPNIAGWSGLVSADGTLTGPYSKGAAVYGVTGVSYSTNPGIFFDPSRVSSIYGAAATVQSPAIAVNIFIKY
ncbi:phage tail protein [Desulfovibrio desulfuricans]|uniref:phage tail protein n=1 Tax=Desulfovibrio desulfuricans TaxID=876 RepID=UPI00398420E9